MNDVKVGTVVGSGDFGSPALGEDSGGNYAVFPVGFVDAVNNKAVVEHSYTYSGPKTSDTLVKSGVGFLHAIQISCNDAAPTAGNLDIYDNTAGSGTKIFSCSFTTTWFAPVNIPINVEFSTGLYLDFTTTADVNVSVSYR